MKNRPRRRCALTLGFVVAGALVALGQAAPVVADGPPQSASENGKQQDAKTRTVRMNFFNATWPHVLRKVAERSGSQLVMERAPAGRLTRTDMHKYTRSEAVRMLNEEMEPQGFRLLEQGNHLVVLHLDELRSRYTAARLPASAEPVSAAAGPAPTQQKDPSVQPTEYRGDAGVTRPPAFQAPVAGAPVTRAPVVRAPQALPRGGAILPRATRPLVVDARNRGAKEVARVIYTALRPRAELIDLGPANLPAFRVFANDGPLPIEQAASVGRRVGGVSTDMQFTVGIDSNREQLVIDASPEQQRGVAQLIRHIDAAGTSSGQVTRLIDMAVDATRVAEHLGPALRMMVTQQPASTEGDADEPPPAKVHVLTNQPQPTATADDPAAEGGGDEPLVQLDGLRGPVTIQDVPGIGMVVTGNQTDVDAVVRIIRELERMSAGAEADVQLLMLRHVNSAALAELMNNVYEELTAIRSVGASQQPLARIVPVVRPNAVLIIAGVGDLEAILDLAEKMDQPTDPRNEIEVFPLASAVATDVVRTIETMYEPSGEGEETTGLRLRVKAVADPRTNTVIVQAAPSDLNEIGLLIRRIDRDVSSSVSRMQVFTLKNAVADELAEVINGALTSILSPAGIGSGQVGGGGPGGGGPGTGGGSGQDTQQLLAVKSVVLELLTGGDAASDTVRSGILADIRVTADMRVNSLIVTAPEQSMPLMAALISQLDAPSTNVAEIKVFSLTNSDAVSTMELLETLFSEGDDENQTGVQIVGAEDASSGLIPIRFSIDVRTNSVIAIGGAEALRVVEAVILRLDQSDVRQRKSEVVKLKNTSAELVAVSINEFLESQRDLAAIDPELVSNVELLEQEIIVVAEPISNSLLISTTEHYRDDILDMVKILDEAPEQVVIQVLIVEVLLENTDEFGVELGFQDSVLFNRSLVNVDNFLTIDQSTSNPGTGVVTTTQQIISQEGVPGFLFNNNPIGNNLSPIANPSKVGSQGLSSFSLGRINGDLGFGGLVMSASSEAVSVLIRALSAKRDVQILSRPQIRTVDNQLAEIFVGQQVPVITGTNINGLGGISPVIGAPQQVGIILQVTPRITPDGVIVMETIANKSAISGEGVPLVIDTNTGAVVESQIFDVTEAHATVAVPDGQTIVLGGMITKAEDTLERKVPWLGDIPILGAAFRYDGTSTRRTELLIFMTPRIVKNSLDSEMIKQIEIERMHFLECDAEEIHGPLYSVPPATPATEQDDAEELPSDDLFYPTLPDDEDDVPTTVMPALRSPSAVHHPGAAAGVVPASLNQPIFTNNAQPAGNAQPVAYIHPQPLPGAEHRMPQRIAPAMVPATAVQAAPQPYIGPQQAPAPAYTNAAPYIAPRQSFSAGPASSVGPVRLPSN